jgi:putative cell wall-binding protein
LFSGLSLGRRRIGLAATAAVAVGTAITIVAINGASASHAGDKTVGLSASNGSKTISWQTGGPAALTLKTDSVTGGAWSPDGSRMVFVNQNSAIETVRFNNATDTAILAAADGDTRSHPTWTDDGSVTLWSAHVTDTTGTHDTIEFAVGTTDWNTINLDAGTDWTHPDGGPGTTIVLQGQVGNGTPNVYSIDESNLFDATVDPGTPLVSNASSPSASPINNSVAFIRDDASSHAQVWVFNPVTNTTTQVTTDAVDHSNPTWSPDGKTIAFDEGTTVLTAPAAGGATSPTGLTGVPAYQSAEQDGDIRLAGANRYETAIAVSQLNWASAGDQTGPTAAAVVLSRGDTFADALGGSALAAAKNGPLLLTPPTSLFPDTKTEIQRLLGSGSGKTVYLVGGTGALSAGVASSITAMGLKAVRLSGDNRYETAVAVAKAINPSPDQVLAATGLNFPDALSAGAAAGSYDVPGSGTSAVVVLTADKVMPPATQSYLNGLEAGANPPSIVGIGGAAAAALDASGLPGFGIVGDNRYETAQQVADFFFFGAHFFGAATGTNFPDALSGGAMLATLGGPLLLTPPTAANATVAGYLSQNSASYFAEFGFGGSSVVSNSVMSAYATAMSGPEAFFNGASAPRASTGGKSAAQGQHLDATPKARAQKAAEKRLPDFKHLPSYVEKIN